MRTPALLLALLVPCAAAAQEAGLTPNTLAFDSAAVRQDATLADVAWLAGHWRGPGLGGECEEIWSAPQAGSMMGMFRLMKDDAIVFYELMTLQPDGNSVAMVLKHFNADMTGWEEKGDVVRFPLIRHTADALFFDGLTFRRTAPDEILVQLAIRLHDGSVREEEFRYSRVQN